MPLQNTPGILSNNGALVLLQARLVALTGATLHLYKNDLVPDPTKVAADFLASEADFVGYAAATLTWSPVGSDAEGNFVSLSNRAFFQATDATKPNITGGAFLLNNATTPQLLEYFPFDPQLDFTSALKFAGVVLQAAGQQTDMAIIDF